MPRMMLPPPQTTPSSRPVLASSEISRAVAWIVFESMPKPCAPARLWPEIFSRTRL